jgi:hypothetical protein
MSGFLGLLIFGNGPLIVLSVLCLDNTKNQKSRLLQTP